MDNRHTRSAHGVGVRIAFVPERIELARDDHGWGEAAQGGR
jgi:hypothetical protein